MRRWCLGLLGIALLFAPARGQTPELAKAGSAYVQGLQTADGGFLPALGEGGNSKGKSTLRATSAAVRALKYFGAQPRDRAAAARYVRSCFDPASGGFADQPGGRPDVMTTAVGAMAAVELQLPADLYAGPA
jgi:hypothetical protein